jgi:peptide/nickel transport system substrate-binding protein
VLTEKDTPVLADERHPLGHAMLPVRPGGEYAHAIEKDVGNWNLLHSDGNMVETGMVVQNLAPSTFIPCPDLRHRWNQDLLAAEPRIVDTEPQTIVYRINPDAVWNDGTPVTAADFVYTYRVQNGTDGAGCKVSTHAGYELVESVVGEAGGLVRVTFRPGAFFPDWESMFCYIHPAHVAAGHGDLATPAGLAAAFDSFNDRVPTWSAGPFQVERHTPGVEVVLVPNPRWYGRVKPALDRIRLVVLGDQADLVPALRDRRINGMNPQPDPGVLAEVATLPGIRHSVATGFVWDHLDLNTRTPALADVVLRRALFTAVDREELVRETVARLVPDARPLDSHCFVPGLPGYRDLVTPSGQGRGDVDRARDALASAGYTVSGGGLWSPDGDPLPTLRIRFVAGNPLRARTAELLIEQWARIGVTARAEPTTNQGEVLGTGDYDAVLFGWNGNPARVGPARDMYASNGGMNFGHFEHPEVDRLIGQAAATLDLTRAHALLNDACAVLAEHAYVLPLYQRPSLLAHDERFVNIENNPTNGLVVYNIEHWGRGEHAANGS